MDNILQRGRDAWSINYSVVQARAGEAARPLRSLHQVVHRSPAYQAAEAGHQARHGIDDRIDYACDEVSLQGAQGELTSVHVQYAGMTQTGSFIGAVNLNSPPRPG